MIADIYTKCMANPEDWDILRNLVGIFRKSEIEDGVFNPDVLRCARMDPSSAAAECLKEDILNHHYRMAMSGESTKNSDFRKKVKVKPPKKKDPLKGKIPHEVKASKKKVYTAREAVEDNKENTPSGGPTVETTSSTQKGKCFTLRRGVSRKSGYQTYSVSEKVGLVWLPI